MQLRSVLEDKNIELINVKTERENQKKEAKAKVFLFINNNK